MISISDMLGGLYLLAGEAAAGIIFMAAYTMWRVLRKRKRHQEEIK